MAYIRPAVAEMVISTALGHRILQSVQLPGAERGTLAIKLQHHRGSAIRMMAEDLARDDMRTSDEILVCVLVFLLAEVSEYFPLAKPTLSRLLAKLTSLSDSAIHFLVMATACRCGDRNY